MLYCLIKPRQTNGGYFIDLAIFLVYFKLDFSELGAHSSAVEQRTHNPLVVGSNPTGPKKESFIV